MSIKNKCTWRDIVKVNGEIHAEEFPISGDKDCEGIYIIDDYIEAVAEKYGVERDSIETYMMDGINFDPFILPYGAEECGCYINGVAEWMIGYWDGDN